MLDDIAEAVWSAIKYILVEIVANIVLFYLGFLTLRLITLWRYPPKDMNERQEKIVVLVGMVMPLVVFGVFLVVNNYGSRA